MRKFLPALFVFFALGAVANPTAPTPEFTARVEAYVNSLRHISGDFTQRSSNGKSDSGTFHISKPGRMRLEYKSPILLIADGRDLVYYDKKLEQISYISLASNPASIVLTNDVSLSSPDSPIRIREVFETDNNTTEIFLSYTYEKRSGEIVLIFTTKPFALAGWRIRDAQGITTEITLSNIRPATGFDASLFRITGRGVSGGRTTSRHY
ncbi:MAG: outer membrane lipoprotein carrier protein LolA [Alphaproteobacteria bacterium]|nr:outer membrane lipoprotein carrier protein LolA [Alphaproteobacteria bacterium]